MDAAASQPASPHGSEVSLNHVYNDPLDGSDTS